MIMREMSSRNVSFLVNSFKSATQVSRIFWGASARCCFMQATRLVDWYSSFLGFWASVMPSVKRAMMSPGSSV